MKHGEEGRARAFVLFGVIICMSLIGAVAALASGGSSGSTGGPVGSIAAAHAAKASVCGAGTGKKATGSPIKIGGINTFVPGTDFTDIGHSAQAYFNCVNDNGGIKGHPIQYTLETEAIDPGQAKSAAQKLIQSLKVVALVGNSSIIEASVNHAYYEKQGYYVIGAGIAPEAYGTSHFASVNMGPRYSSDGAAQYALSLHPNKLVFDQSKVPGTDYNVGGVKLIAKKAKVPLTALTDDVPIQDANSVAVKLVQAAGPKGGVVLNFTPPEALKILQAAQKQGLENKVQSWTCSTPCNTDFLAKALGSGWDGKFFVNAELALTSAKGPDSVLYRSVLSKYGKKVTGGLGSFSQMGFLDARIATQALLNVKGAYTAKSVNAAIKGIKGFKTDILCKPWYYGPGAIHLPNNTDQTVTPKGGHMVSKQGCFPIDAVDPGVAQARKIEKSGQT